MMQAPGFKTNSSGLYSNQFRYRLPDEAAYLSNWSNTRV
jgi:hypothetical protein